MAKPFQGLGLYWDICHLVARTLCQTCYFPPHVSYSSPYDLNETGTSVMQITANPFMGRSLPCGPAEYTPFV